jgi:ABC-type sugar transport system substrate-binding protein
MKRVIGLRVVLLLGFGLARDTFKIGALIKNESNPFFITMHQGFDFAAARNPIPPQTSSLASWKVGSTKAILTLLLSCHFGQQV